MSIQNEMEQKSEPREINGFTQLSESEKKLQNIVESILGKKFKWRVVGFGSSQSLEVEVPEEMASKESKANYAVLTDREWDAEFKKATQNEDKEKLEWLERMKDGRRRFPKGHPKEGEICGDIRVCLIQNEEQIKKWLNMVKNNIIKSFQLDGKNLPLFE